jgi:putative nucleotidyltransferase with HDIG domain
VCSLAPGDFHPAAYESLHTALATPDSGVSQALAEAAEGAPGVATLEAEDGSYRVWVRELRIADAPDAEPAGYIVSAVSQAVTTETERTTTQLIIMWSVVAVVALVGLGVWVARRVSAPLAALSDGAQRVADGDFYTKIEVSGANEIADLAESFNQMTDSLRERSESLTKKVLELATLYEMSRSLGSTLEMEVLLENVLDSALRIFDLELGYVTVRDQDTGHLDLVAWRASGDDRPDEKALRNSMSEWVIREGRPLIFNPGEGVAETRIDDVSGALAALCVPLTAPEGSIGAICVGSHDPEFRFNGDDVRLLSTIANHVTIAIGNIELFSSLQEAYLSTVRSLAAAVDAKDAFTRGHSDKVAAYGTMIGERLGLAHEQRIALEMAAYLHDIGKIGISEEILLKPGKLSDAEMAQMSHHPLIGANILKPVGFPWPITPIVRHHHERWDGGGYPAGLKGEEIPLLARVLSVADAFEAMTSDRPYRSARTIEEALEELVRCSGTQFDPRVVQAFEEVMSETPVFEEGIDVGDLEDVDADEAQAIFVAVAEGMLDSFRKLGGPRLAANVEKELTESCRRAGIPVSVAAGRVTSRVDEIEDHDTQLIVMRETLRIFDETMGRMSGTTLVDHFYADALSALSGRMQRIASELDFHTA